MMGKVHVYDHPLIQHKMTIMRKAETQEEVYRFTEDIFSVLQKAFSVQARSQ